jgi:Gylcosyl hydrolase family 115 C-terminal domain/Glycosyl hydrolase family 115
MDLSYQRGARALWIVNVGDIKPMEFPLSFFMDQAWNPEAMTAETLANYPEEWSRATFGPKQGKAIGELITRYSQLGAIRKPELIDPTSFALGEGTGAKLDGGEFGQLIARWQTLERDLARVKKGLPVSQRDAFFQIVEHPIIALSNLYQLYYDVAWNRRLAAVGDARANLFADRAEAAFRRDQEIADQYHALNGGKWDGMMLQTHIGYTTWQQPDEQVMPEVKRVTSGAAPKKISFATPGPSATGVGVITIEAADFARGHGGNGMEWRVIPNLGRGPGAVTAFPQGQPATSQNDGVYLEYAVNLAKAGDTTVQLHVLPTLETRGGVDVRLGVSIDDRAMQVVALRLIPSPDPPKVQEQRDWEQAVIDNNFVLEVKIPDVEAGKHTLKVWRIDDNALLSRIVVR